MRALVETRIHRRLEILAFAAIYVIWGSTYLAIRVGVQTLPPFLMAGSRFLLAGGIIFLVLVAWGQSAPSGREWLHAGIAGTLMLAGGNGLVTWAELRVPSNLAALLIAGTPLHIALLDWLRPGGTRPSPRVMWGIGIGALGMIFLVAPSASDAHASDPAAVLAILFSGLLWAAGSLYSRYGRLHPNPLVASSQQMIAGGIVLLALSLVTGEPGHLSLAAISSASMAAFAYLTVFGSMVAFSAFGWLVKNSTPTRLSTSAYVNPVVAVILGWALLGETLPGRAMVGALLIVAAVVVMTLQRSRPAPSKNTA